MPWDTWPLLTIAILCGSTILWSWWGFHTQSRPPQPTHLRPSIIGGGYLELPCQTAHTSGRHRRTSPEPTTAQDISIPSPEGPSHDPRRGSGSVRPHP
ncbi:hypothetical protein NSK11_contig00059-0002 [Nocardia seriolae]|uniref:Secreted protein n=1 Tax=Nocardia seriolae TaxID=37332 RepID=A0ABC9YVZ2_9NOCA|nr:hypothetical protein NSER024013_68890 [Nocardia seriolae]GAP29557.1 hypothetical protein NSK11_contig00059-0002 [Nocardia seriolae]GEM25180.1 hypothetical protein NS2_34190 [Nocardia seriolae NBRC 15557]